MKKVFIVEDNLELQHMYERAFRLGGYEVEECASGADALERLSRPVDLPDAILLDIIIPEVSGLDVLRSIRKDKKWDCVPVIMLTNSFAPANEQLFLSLGANMYITKMDHDAAYIVEKTEECLFGACTAHTKDEVVVV